MLPEGQGLEGSDSAGDDDDTVELSDTTQEIARMLQGYLGRQKLDVSKVWIDTNWRTEVCARTHVNHPHDMLLTRNFSQFLAGMRATRSNFVFQLAKNHLHLLNIADLRFPNKKTRKDLPEVAKMLAHKAFLYDPNLPRKQGHLRHPCILKVSSFYCRDGDPAQADHVLSCSRRPGA